MATGLSNGGGLSATTASLILRALNSGLSYRGSLPGSEESGAWESAVIANGGTVSPARKTIVQDFIAAEMAAGTWELTDDYWALWAENAVQALTSLKQRRLATAVAAPAFVADRGYTSGGAGYIDTGFFLNLHPVAMTGTNLRIAAYSRTNVGSASSIPAGVSIGGSQNLLVIPRSAAGNLQAWVNATAVGPGGDVLSDSRGWSVASRNGTLVADVKAYKNGVPILPFTPGAVSSTLAARQIFICAACLSGGTAGSFYAGQISFVAAGAALSPAQELVQYNNVQAWAASVGAAFEPEVATWAASVVTNGGTVSAARLDLVSSLVAKWRAAGIWDLIDDAWLLVAENSQQALTSLKQRRLATAVAAPTFTVDRGYAFNGTTQYIDTLFVPSVNKVAMTGTNMHIAVYERTNVSTATVAAGGFNFSTSNLFVYPRTGAALAVACNNSTSGGGDAVADSRGLTVGSRNGTLVGDVLAYRNGVAIVPSTVAAVGATLPTMKIFIGGYANNTNVLTVPRAATEGFVSVGADIPASLQPAFYNALQSYMTAVGANV